MSDPDRAPLILRANAWCAGRVGLQGMADLAWGLRNRPPRQLGIFETLAPAELPDERDWRHPDVGWGLVAADDPTLSSADKAAGADLPDPIRQLIRARKGPLFRYDPAIGARLRAYFSDGSSAPYDVAGGARGIGEGKIPRYLLILGSPQVVPWRFQYQLNSSAYVGRLDLTGDALANYVQALLSDWSGIEAHPAAPLVWSVDFGGGDITSLMRRLLSDRLWTKLTDDPGIAGGTRLTDADATSIRLAAAIDATRPGLVVTTSHGLTAPLDDAATLKAHLGALVGDDLKAVGPADLPRGTGGAIWYAHACCSAGADDRSQFEDLFPVPNTLGETLRGVAKGAGAMVAPLPRHLLGAAKPARAFVGHVEPTFDWTLKDPSTGQRLTAPIIEALYIMLYQARRCPIGYAFSKVYAVAAAMRSAYDLAVDRVTGGDLSAATEATYRRIAALDRQSIVILGDPTVTLAP